MAETEPLTKAEEEKILKTLETLLKALPTAQAELSALQICDDVDPRPVLTDIATRAARAIGIAKKMHERQTSPFRQMLERLDSIWRPLIAGFDDVVKSAKGKAGAWVLSENRRRLVIEQQKTAAVRALQEQQRKAEEEARRAPTMEKRVVAEVEAGRLFAKQEQMVAEMPAAVPQAVTSGASSMSTPPDWDYEVVDIAAFAKAHPDCVEIKRAPTIALARQAGKTGGSVDGLKIIDRVKVILR